MRDHFWNLWSIFWWTTTSLYSDAERTYILWRMIWWRVEFQMFFFYTYDGELFQMYKQVWYILVNSSSKALMIQKTWILGILIIHEVAIPLTIYPLLNSHNYGKSPFWMGKLTISVAIFNSKLLNYQRDPEGISTASILNIHRLSIYYS